MENPAGYRGVLLAFMSYTDDVTYGRETVFTMEHLGAISAQNVLDWFNFRAYGTTAPTLDARPTMARSNSLMHWKKALSYYMPNKNHQWNEMTETGNPTKSVALNEMIRKVRRFEVRGQGATSKARRALKEPEFRAIMTELREYNDNDIVAKYGVGAMLCFQFHMIGRVDDCCKWMRSNLAPHDIHGDKCAKARLPWSKNVNEERSAPWQHMFGCMDWVFCTLLNVGLWLEIFHSRRPQARHTTPFVFGFSEEQDIEKATLQTKSTVYRILRPIFEELGVLIGSHSIRKYASTWARSNGIAMDDKDHRGRWKNTSRISNRYDDVQLDFVDANVAAILCPGGVCNYVIRDPACTPEWVSANVTPAINAVFGQQMAYLFGKALLWLAFSPQQNHMPQELRTRIHMAFNVVRTLPEGTTNPIEKVLVAVTGHEAIVYMEDINISHDHQPPPGPNAPPAPQAGPPHVVTPTGTPTRVDNVNGQPNRQLLLSVMSSVNSLRRSIIEQGNSLESVRNTMKQHDRTMKRLVQKIDSNPIQMLQRAAQGRRRQGMGPQAAFFQDDAAVNARAVLTPNPRTLHVLWDEYVNGVGNNKPAKFFTRGERGRSKYKYSRRKVFWSIVEDLVRANVSATDAIERIYTHYGPNLSPTAIINAIRQDKKNESLPHTLRV